MKAGILGKKCSKRICDKHRERERVRERGGETKGHINESAQKDTNWVYSEK